MMKKNINRCQFLQASATHTAGLGLCQIVVGFKQSGKDFYSNDDGYVALFDGRSLDGWHKNGARRTVRDGMIISELEPPGSGND